MAQHDFKTLFEEFMGAEWSSAQTRARRELWLDARDDARLRWARVLALRARNMPYTDAVLEGLLPYADTPANRARGRWVHPSSTLSADVRAWFERAGWTTPGAWPLAAYAVVQFIERCMLCPEKLQEVCDRFTQHAEVRGFGSSLLSPVLNALVPDRYRVVNAHSLCALRAFTGVPWSPRVETYPKANEALADFIERHRAALECEAARAHRPADVLDMFCRWFVARSADAHDEAWDRLQAATRDVAEVPCWKVTPGDQSPRWFKCLADQAFAFAWPELGDVTALSREGFDAKVQALAVEHEGYRNAGVEHLWRIARSPRAILLAAHGGGLVLGAGRVTGPYRYVPGERFPHRLPVDWFDTAERPLAQPGWSRAVVGLDLHLVEDLLGVSYAHVYDRDEVSGEVAREDAPALPVAAVASAAGAPPPATAFTAPTVRVDLFEAQPGRGAVVRASPPRLAAVPPPAALPPPPRRATAPSPRLVEARAEPPAPAPPLARLAEETAYPEADLRRWIDALRRRGQCLVRGPAGTGKTWLALRLARHLAGDAGHIDVLHLHPGYRYGDLVERAGQGGASPTPGRLLEFLARARERTAPSVLVLDDLHRVDAARVLGEALHALEYRARPVRLAGGAELAVPPDVLVIATAGARGPLDASVRRRFAPVPLPPRYDVLERFHARRGFDASGLSKALREASRALGDDRLALGTAPFLREDLADVIDRVWEDEALPHLAEHLADAAALDAFRWDRVRDVVLGG